MSYPEKISTTLINSFINITDTIFNEKLKVVDEVLTIDESTSYTSWIELKDESLRGLIAVTTSWDTLMHCHPERRYGEEINDDDILDWAGELSNRLLGLSKSTLKEFGIEARLSSPYVSKGDFQKRTDLSSPVLSIYFKNSEYSAKISFQANISKENLSA